MKIEYPRYFWLRWLVLLVILAVVLLLASCNSTQTTQVAEVTSTSLPTSTPTPAPTATSTSTPTPTATPTPTPLSPAAIFDLVSPSVAFIDTPAGSGSGFMVKDKYLVTNSHVVWPFDAVRVVFPDGTEIEDAPVVQWDLMADLAVVGPLDVDIPALQPVEDENFEVGSDVYLVGYPGEVEEFPKPTFSSGLISRQREWERGDITFYQTDAAIAGGQSGGVLVTPKGKVIGISGLSFAGREFGLVASMLDILPRIEKMIAGEDVDGIKQHPLHNTSNVTSNHQLVMIENMWDIQAFVIWPEEDGEVKVEITNDHSDNTFFLIRDAARGLVTFDEDGSFIATKATFMAKGGVPYFVIVGSDYGHGSCILLSDHPLIPYKDRDDGRAIHVGDTYLGSIDYPGDVDYFVLELDVGEVVNIKAESVAFNPQIAIQTEQTQYLQPVEALAGDDDSGGGVFGWDASLTFKAPEKGTYFIVVTDVSYSDMGGYYLTVNEPTADDPTPVVPTPTPTPTPRPTRVSLETGMGRMFEFVSPSEPHFSIPYPAKMKPGGIACDPEALACYEFPPIAAMLAYDFAYSDFDFSNLNYETWMKLFAHNLERTGMKNIESSTFVNSSGLKMGLTHATTDDGLDAWYISHLVDGHVILITMLMVHDPSGLDSDDAILGAEYIEKMEKQFFSDLKTNSLEELVRFMADQFTIQE